MRLPSPFSLFRASVLLLLAFVPLVTLVHRDDLGRWDLQRSAMAAPDEFSYLLMARHYLHGGGLSTEQALGRDTFYPPGYPLLLAAWAKGFGLTAFTPHALNAVLLSAATFLAFFLSRHLLRRLTSIPPAPVLTPAALDILALVITALFATNWHILETSLLVMSEPLFMVVTFIWLLFALRLPDWPEDPWRTCVLTVLAIAAWSIRGAGIVCVATTFLYALWHAFRHIRAPKFTTHTDMSPTHWRPRFEGRLAPLIIVLTFVIAYQSLLAAYSPEKSLLAGQESANSYPKQLLQGLMVKPAPPDDPQPWLTVSKAWAQHMSQLVGGHLQDYASSFVPWPREEPDASVRLGIGWFFGMLGLGGFFLHAWRTTRTKIPNAGGAFVTFYVLLYGGLYLIWPFNFARFWSPLLPIMLVYVALLVVRFSRGRRRVVRWAPAALLLIALLGLSAEEVTLQLGFYARRLNYVSDALRDGVRAIMRAAPDPQAALVTGKGDDELYALAWYFAREPGGGGYQLRASEPHLPVTGKRERADQMLVRSAEELGGKPNERLFFFSYFPNADTRDTLQSFHALRPKDSTVKVFQKGIEVSIWEIHISPATLPTTTHEP
jgi:hypothetical protein